MTIFSMNNKVLMGIFQRILGCLYCDATRTKTRRKNSAVETIDCVTHWQPLLAHARCSRERKSLYPSKRKFSVAEIPLHNRRIRGLPVHARCNCHERATRDQQSL